MKKILPLLLVFNIGICFCQQSPSSKELNERTLKSLSQIKSFCLIKRPDGHDTLVSDIYLKYNDYVSQKPYSNQAEAVKVYGTKSVIVITLKPGITLLNLKKEIMKYKLSEDAMNLPVRFDNYKHKERAENIVVTPNVIKSVQISKDSLTSERFLDVRTGARLRPYKEKIVL